MKGESLEYLAGIIDGEGTIGVYKLAQGRRFDYFQQISVGNTEVLLIYWLVDNFGGRIPKIRKGKGNRKDSYVWALYGSNSYKLIKKVMSHLLLKQEQADNAMELWEKVSKFVYNRNKPRPLYKTKLAEELYQRNKLLNMRGRVVEESDLIEEPKLVRKVTTLEEYE